MWVSDMWSMRHSCFQFWAITRKKHGTGWYAMSPCSWIFHVSSGIFPASFVSPLLFFARLLFSAISKKDLFHLFMSLTLLFLFLFRWLSLVCLPSPFTIISSFSPLPHIPLGPHQGAFYWVCGHKIFLYKIQHSLFNNNKGWLKYFRLCA